MSPEDKKALLQAMISSIEIYDIQKGKRADGHLIKTIHFTFPVTYDGESGALFVRTNEQQVETVVLMTKTERKKSIKACRGFYKDFPEWKIRILLALL